ncbi:MAG: polysaccharide biosynthesis protein [Anaerocolumna aminovalerica]|jgi:stage V sporulation protein B|uniref:putative polysaccharide biosynthesis protein n=1 Tax=Anaerocolumna aminovalerica TaxID=1527 RepID=UPI0029063D11|nr:polysaccharide biosynthesis protein [Anaerocolumna aminovalerica]MDU6265742.1 polysaccharide biosynthesis protein [Anaerocolumna aminovalerica]
MINQKKKDSFIKQAGILAMAGIICRIIGILYRSPLTGIIGDEGNGYYSVAYNIYTIILLVSSYSIPSAISKVIAQKLAMKEYRNAQRIFYCSIIYVVVVGGLASLFTYFGAGILVQSNSIGVLKVFAPTIFISGLLGVLRGYFQAHRTMVPTSISQIIEQIMNAVISILAAYLLMQTVADSDSTTIAIYGATGSAIGTGTGVLIAFIFMLLVYLVNRKIIHKRLETDTHSTVAPYSEIIMSLLLTVTPFILSTFIYNSTTSLNQTIYSKILINLKGMDEVSVTTQYGIFAGKSVVIANIPIAIASAISSAVIPSIAGSYIQGDLTDTNRKVDKATKTTMIIAIPAAVGLAALSIPIVRLLFPQKESMYQAAGLLCVLSITVIFYSLSTLSNAVLQGIGKVNMPVINAFVSLLIQTAFLVIILLTTNMNLYGLAVASIIYSLLMCIFNGISIRKSLGYKQNMRKCYFIPLLSSLIMGAVAGLIYMGLYTLIKSNAISLFVAIFFGAILYFILMIKLRGITKNEIEGLPKGELIIRVFKKLRIL